MYAFMQSNIVFYKSISFYNKKQDRLPHFAITVYCRYNYRCLDIVETTVMSAWQVRNVVERTASLKLPCTFINHLLV